ncbi:ABC transporter substrate-binding protein [Mycolicibacterium sp. BiH015]|uniref:ABC transporter substrate-binding protein n=1 Tax=Mycolicibacterium sp. BiH015 TaxID=3018808 RepID=UPI0022E1053B|nr:ABC transporter substrate-binding protein [Mycolicibacterium sp. BiH015]MDA2889358.1 ABC transporter substrate-binding protein [Mycolicibacterium sp. BiH015]
MLQLNISATAHALNYLPQYYADHVGVFADHQLAVGATARDPWTGVLDDLDSGVADVALGGLWVPAMYHAGPRDVTVFAQVNHQFPKALVTREPRPNFAWSDLIGKTVLAPGIGGSAPYAFTAGLIRESGVDPGSITFLRDLSTPMYVEMFGAGLGDAIVTDLVTAEAMQRSATGYIAADYLEVGGLGPNSVYYCRTDRFGELSERLVRFVSALQESMQLLTSAGVEDLAPLMRDHWPTMPLGTLSGACERMLHSHTWHTPVIDAEATDRWTGILYAENMITRQPRFEDLVDTSIVDRLSVLTPR